MHAFIEKHKMVLLALGVVLLFATFTRFYRLSIPKEYVFDEVYHAVTAKLYARNDPSGYEWWHEAPEPKTAIEWLHPPLAKLTQAAGILIFGENSLGWRVSSAVFGVATVLAVYVLAFQLTKSKPIGVIASAFTSLDGLLLAQSRIAMNDIHLTFFVVLSVLFYSRWKKHKTFKELFLSGLFAGLAIASKWSGVFVVGVYIADTLLTIIRTQKLPKVQTEVRMFLVWIVMPAMIYVLSFAQFWAQGHTWTQFKELHNQIWQYQTHLKATHGYQSTPVQWVFDLRPVWMYVSYEKGGVANIYNTGNPIIFLFGFASMWIVLYSLTKKWNASLALLLIAYGAMWIPWVFSPRIMFFYHYAPAVPFLCVALAWWAWSLIKSKKMWSEVVGWNILLLAFVWFVVFYPNLTGIPVPQDFAKAVYFLVPSWK